MSSDIFSRARVTHHLKLQRRFFAASLKMEKPFEVRLNDRDFQVGDDVVLEEVHDDNREYTGRVIPIRRITFILEEWEGVLATGYVILGLKEWGTL